MGLQVAPGYIAKQGDGVTDFQHPVEMMRNLLAAQCGRRSGRFRYGDFTVASTGSGMNVTVSSGSAYLNGVENSSQGGYFLWSNGSDTLTFGAASGSTRYDTILARVADVQYGTISGSPRAYWEIVPGAAGAGAPRADSYFNVGGGSYNPGAWYRVADVQIDPSDTTISNAKIVSSNQFINPPGGKVLCLSTARPAFPTFGDCIAEIDTGLEWFYDGIAWQMMGTYRRVVTLGVDTSNASFANIPTSLKHLRITWNTRSTGSSPLFLRFNSDNGANYRYQNFESFTAGTNNNSSLTAVGVRLSTIPVSPATTWASGVVDVFGWNSPHSNYLSGTAIGGYISNTSGDSNNALMSWAYTGSGPYTSVTFVPNTGSLAAGSQFILEGIA